MIFARKPISLLIIDETITLKLDNFSMDGVTEVGATSPPSCCLVTSMQSSTRENNGSVWELDLDVIMGEVALDDGV
jgi:hypothetical protein